MLTSERNRARQPEWRPPLCVRRHAAGLSFWASHRAGHAAPRSPVDPHCRLLATGPHGHETVVRAGACGAPIAGAVAPPHCGQRAADVIRAGTRDPRPPEAVNSPSVGQSAARYLRWPSGRGHETPFAGDCQLTVCRPAGRAVPAMAIRAWARDPRSPETVISPLEASRPRGTCDCHPGGNA